MDAPAFDCWGDPVNELTEETNMNSHAAPVTVESDVVPETVIVKLTVAQRRFVERQARAELRSISNWMRSLVVERMGE